MNSVFSLNKRNVLRFAVITVLILAMALTTTAMVFAAEEDECCQCATFTDAKKGNTFPQKTAGADGRCDTCGLPRYHTDNDGDGLCDGLNKNNQVCGHVITVTPGVAIGSVLGIVFTLVQYAGIVMLVFGIVILTLALRNEDADSKNRAILYIISAVAMIALKSLTGVLLDALGVDIVLD